MSWQRIQTGMGALPRHRRGSALVITLLVVMLIFTLGSALLALTTSALLRSRADLLRAQALDLAEAGVEKAVYYLRGTAPDGTTDGSWRTGGTTETLSGAGSYTFSISNGTGDDAKRIIIISTGTATLSAKSTSRRVRATLNFADENINAWNNLIFAGVGQSGHSINGNVVMRGGVKLQGDGEPYTDTNGNGHWDTGEPYTDLNGNGAYSGPLAATDTALDMGGGSDIGNNYSGMSSTLRSSIPACSTTTFGGETVESLSAKLRVEHGRVNLSGSATIGAPNVTGGSPAVKETMDATYVTDGFSGSSSAVYSDNGTSHPYDLTDKVGFPDVVSSTTINNTSYSDHMAYLSAYGLHITGPLDLQPDQTYSASDAYGNSISVDGHGNMTIHGIVYVDGNINFNAGSGSGNNTFRYSGKGTLSATGSVYVHTNLLPTTQFPTTDALGVVARHRLELATGSGDSQLTMAGAFYAQEQIVNGKQTELAGAFVSSYFSLSNVPHMYQVPSLADNLPPGLPGASAKWLRTTQIRSWREIAP